MTHAGERYHEITVDGPRYYNGWLPIEHQQLLRLMEYVTICIFEKEKSRNERIKKVDYK